MDTRSNILEVYPRAILGGLGRVQFILAQAKSVPFAVLSLTGQEHGCSGNNPYV